VQRTAREPSEDSRFRRAQAVRGSRASTLFVRTSNGEKASAGAAAVAFPSMYVLSLPGVAPKERIRKSTIESGCGRVAAGT
jgi:hypothetical protein